MLAPRQFNVLGSDPCLAYLYDEPSCSLLAWIPKSIKINTLAELPFPKDKYSQATIKEEFDRQLHLELSGLVKFKKDLTILYVSTNLHFPNRLTIARLYNRRPVGSGSFQRTWDSSIYEAHVSIKLQQEMYICTLSLSNTLTQTTLKMNG